MELSLPRGTKDYNPGETILLNQIILVIEETFKRFGFHPITTPSIELLSTLNAKAYGEDAKKEIYKIDGAEEGLRYDFTVPLARFMAMNRDLPLPFKRYQIGNVWRMDEPQKMRNREFIQADIDIIGSSEPLSDAEVISPIAFAFDELGITNYRILINNRAILDRILSKFKVPAQKHNEAIRVIDKLAKISRDEIIESLISIGIKKEDAIALISFIDTSNEKNEETMARLHADIPEAKDPLESLESLFKLLKLSGLEEKIKFDISLARGLDYYTGGVWEFVIYEEGKRLPTIASGGRYDNLIEMYSKNSMPAVGSAIGVSRVFELLNKTELVRTYSRIHIAYIKEENQEYATEMASILRKAGIYTDLGVTKRPLAKQLEYANTMRIKYVAIIGNQERLSKKIRLRDMISGEEELLDVEEVISKLKS